MELTPLKVTGKRQRGDAQTDPPTAATHHKKLRQAKPAQKTVSYLELMPLEILEPIFWYSENVHLTRASPRIGRFLSGLSTLRETFIYAFKPTWESSINPYWACGLDDLNSQGNPEFQSALLEHSWADISFIWKCWNLHLSRRGHKQRAARIEREFWSAFDALLGLEETEQDAPHDRGPMATPWSRIVLGGTFFVTNDTRIPDKLLFSTDNEKDLQKYFWMVRSGAKSVDDKDWECIRAAIHHAFVEQRVNKRGKFSYHLLGLISHTTIISGYRWPLHAIKDLIETLDKLDTDFGLGTLGYWRDRLKMNSGAALRYAGLELES